MTRGEIVNALRCTASTGERDCTGCCYLVKQEELEGGEWLGCDVDRIALDAADMLDAAAGSAGGRVMERLTEKHYLGTDHYMKCSENCNVDMDCIDCPSLDRLVERLAAYEDTGLTPEEVLPKDKADEIALKLMRLADLESFCSYTRLRELARADRDGRVVRCRDCEHMEEMIGGPICTFGVCVDCVVPEEFYCAYGKRKDGGAFQVRAEDWRLPGIAEAAE